MIWRLSVKFSSRDGWLSWQRACLPLQLTGLESIHLSKIQNGRCKQIVVQKINLSGIMNVSNRKGWLIQANKGKCLVWNQKEEPAKLSIMAVGYSLCCFFIVDSHTFFFSVVHTVNLCLVNIRYKNPSCTNKTVPQKYVFVFKE